MTWVELPAVTKAYVDDLLEWRGGVAGEVALRIRNGAVRIQADVSPEFEDQVRSVSPESVRFALGDESTDTQATFTRIIRSHLRGNSPGVVILQHPLAEPADGWLALSPVRINIHEDRVYSILDSDSGFSDAYIERAIKELSDAVTCIAFFVPDTLPPLAKRSGSELRELLQGAAEAVEMLVVEGFDGEAYFYVSLTNEIFSRSATGE